MRVGITGHQARDGIDWSWVRNNIRAEFLQIDSIEQAFSSLAVGSDQVFAEVALELCVPLVAVIPFEHYERCFSGKDLVVYRSTLARCAIMQLNREGDTETAFFEAGKKIVENSDVMFAVWDGNRSRGLGGTGDVVEYARANNKLIVHLNPITRLTCPIRHTKVK